MKKTFSLTVMALLAVSLVMPVILATSVGTPTPIDVTIEDFPPMVWMCDDRVVSDDNVQPGRISPGQDEMLERINNYAFEGESIHWTVLVMDKNKIDQNIDVFATIGQDQGEGNDIEVNCKRVGCGSLSTDEFLSCNARILEEEIDYCNEDLMDVFECTLTVETPESMYGEYWITVEADDGDESGTMDENEFWFLNPEIRLSVDGALSFEDVRPGATAYSDTLLVGNDADDGSGVLMDMFISGTDFYDSSSVGTRCSDLGNGPTNALALEAFRYFATSGAYSTSTDFENDDQDLDASTLRDRDAEGYVNIQYSNHWDKAMYDEAEIIQAGGTDGWTPAPIGGPGNSLFYYPANVLAPGAEQALTFKLDLPEPCNGDFDTGAIYFWGEAI